MTAPAGAAVLRVQPVRIEMSADKRFCALTIANDDAADATVQIRGFGWRKEADGSDRLDPDGGPVVNPSIVRIPAGESRLVRCSLPDAGGAAEGGERREQSYRLLIDELPTASVAPGVVRTLLRVSIPLFRAPADAAPLLRWSLAEGGLVLLNEGGRHVQVTAVNLYPAAPGRPMVTLKRGFYLLAGGRMALPVERPEAIGRVEVESVDGTRPASPVAGAR